MERHVLGEERVKHHGRGLAALLLAVIGVGSCSDPVSPTGTIVVIIATSGSDRDADGYLLTVDDVRTVHASIDDVVNIGDIPAGEHRVTLSGIAENCSVSPVSREVTVVAGNASLDFSVVCEPSLGTLIVRTQSDGVHDDPDGYVLLINGGGATPVPANGTTTLRVTAGAVTASLIGFAPNCTSDQTTQTTLLPFEGVVLLDFSITCVPNVGTVVVTTSTAGADLDPDGYGVAVGLYPMRVLAISATATIADVLAGTRAVTLAALATNCSVAGGATRSADVFFHDTTRIAFAITCTPNAGPFGVIAFESDREGSTQIYVARSDGQSPARLTDDSLGSFQPAWSADGTNITFVSRRRPHAYQNEIYVMKADGTGQVRLTTNDVLDVEPSWSPDGRQIVFARSPSGNNNMTNIYLMNADGTGLTALTTGTNSDRHPIFSPDGSRIAFSSIRDGTRGIYTMAADGSDVKSLTPGPGNDEEPSYSRDGSRIVFSSNRSGTIQIHIMNPDGSGVTMLPHTGNNDSPMFSPDGSEIVFANLSNYSDVCMNCSDIYIMKADGSTSRKVTSNLAYDVAPAWKP